LAVAGKVYDVDGQVIKSGLTGTVSIGNASVPVSFEADGTYSATFVSFTGSVASNGDIVELAFVSQDGDEFLRQMELTAKQVANQLAEGLDFTAATPPTVVSPTVADEAAATSQSTDLDYNLTFSENLDYGSLQSSVFRMKNVTDDSGTFDMSLEAALSDSSLGLEVKFWDAVSGGSETTANDVLRLEITSSTVKLLEGKQYRIDLVTNNAMGGTSTDGLKLVLPSHLADGFVFTTIISLTGDVNGDNSVDLLDLVMVAGQFGKSGPDLAGDVNGDNSVDLLDLVKVAGNFGESRKAAAPTLLVKGLTFTTQQKFSVQSAIMELERIPVRSETEELVFDLLVSILPEKLPVRTQLLPNYPNPFNPETWIPFELSQDSGVKLTIYDVVGNLVRVISVGYVQAGSYVGQSRAIYWDGKTDSGESVASGTYFYTLTAEDYTSTQKMIILK